MKTVRIGPNQLVTTSLGFGCGQLFRIGKESSRLRLLGQAYDLGIRHFDIARMYGLGQAEKTLGKFGASRRQHITIASKFGIPMNKRHTIAVRAQGALRTLFRLCPPLKKIAKKATQERCERDYSVRCAEQSLAETLSQLRTDYLDVLFLHDPRLDDEISDELLRWLEDKRTMGVLREYGVAGYFHHVHKLTQKYPMLRRVTQFDAGVAGANLSKYEPYENEGVITFGNVSASLSEVTKRLHAVQGKGSLPDWFSEPNEMKSTFLNFALRESVRSNAYGVTLVSSTDSGRLAELVVAANSEPIVPDGLHHWFSSMLPSIF